MGVEPTSAAWEATVLPLNDTRICLIMVWLFLILQSVLCSMRDIFHIQLNGQTLNLAQAVSISALLKEYGLDQRRVAVEVNGHIVPKSLHAQTMLQAGDRIELVHAMGGG